MIGALPILLGMFMLFAGFMIWLDWKDKKVLMTSPSSKEQRKRRRK